MKFVIFIVGVLISAASTQIVMKTIEQKLDHLNPSDERVWKMYYYELETTQKPGGPIFIYVGYTHILHAHYFFQARNPISLLGRELGGYVAGIGHRFYGNDRPTSDMSVENLKYLTSEQALLDMVEFIRFLKQKPELVNSKVILAGIEDGARLAVYFRMKYPELVDGVWASSAYLSPVVDYPDYRKNIADFIATYGGDKCMEHVKNVFRKAEEIYAVGDANLLKDTFKLCYPFKFEEMAGSLFFASFINTMGVILGVFHNEGVSLICNIFDNSEDDLENYIDFCVNTVYPTKKCFNIDYNNFVNSLKVETYSEGFAFNGRAILYQACNEFGQFKSSSMPNLFGTRTPPDMLYKQCETVFPTLFNQTIVDDAIAHMNRLYGGLKPNVTKVYFTNGALDPSRTLGVLQDLNPEAPADIIPLHGMGADLSADTDNVELKIVQDRARSLILEWIKT